MVTVLTPLLPGLANAVSPAKVTLPSGLVNLYNINWLYGFHTSIFLYWMLNYISPPKETFVSATVPAFADEMGVIEGIERGAVSEEKAYVTKDADVSVSDQKEPEIS